MTYTLALATPETRALVVDALRSEALKRTRVAARASLHVAERKTEGRDVRSESVKVTILLAEAAQLDQLADTLAAAPELPIMTPDPRLKTVTLNDGIHLSDLPNDDGLSDAAHKAAALAGLDDEHIDDDGDIDTGATPEDDPDPDQIEETI